MRHYRLALMGFGNVGKAFVKLLLYKQEELLHRYHLYLLDHWHRDQETRHGCRSQGLGFKPCTGGRGSQLHFTIANYQETDLSSSVDVVQTCYWKTLRSIIKPGNLQSIISLLD